MKLLELRKTVQESLGITTQFGFGHYCDDGISILFKDGKWIVRSSERGVTLDEKSFENEESACNFVLQQIDAETFQPKIE